MSRIEQLADLHSALLDICAAPPGDDDAVAAFFAQVAPVLAQHEPPATLEEAAAMIKVASALLQIARLWRLDAQAESARDLQAAIAGRSAADETLAETIGAFLFLNGASISAIAERYAQEMADLVHTLWDELPEAGKLQLAQALGRSAQ